MVSQALNARKDWQDFESYYIESAGGTHRLAAARSN